jgi:5'-nucleotidase
MRILITNDDGVYAPGIAALHQSLSTEHEVVVVAPETEQSAVGHAITIVDPIRVRPLGPRTGMNGWAISGTPADCVKLAICELLDQPPQMVLSGINNGSNVGVNLLYSGTISAASEAAIRGLPALAISLDSHDRQADFEPASKIALHLVNNYNTLNMQTGALLSVNVPALPAGEMRGYRITRQSMGRLTERFLRRQDPRGRTYYWQDGEIMEPEGSDCDHGALLAGYITLTPVSHDLTAHRALGGLSLDGVGKPPTV